MKAFTDGNDGYYQHDGDDVPAWAAGMTEVAVAEIPLSQIAATKRAEIDAGFLTATSFIAAYPQHEQLSWRSQEDEARAYLLNPLASTPTLSSIVAGTGETMTVLANKVIANADAFKPAGGAAIGRKRARMKEIDTALAAGDKTTLEAITW